MDIIETNLRRALMRASWARQRGATSGGDVPARALLRREDSADDERQARGCR